MPRTILDDRDLDDLASKIYVDQKIESIIPEIEQNVTNAILASIPHAEEGSF